MDKTETQQSESVFDPATARTLQAAAAKKLQALLKAKQKANNAASSREFAVRCVRGLEATVHQLFDVGASSQDILIQLIEALPAISTEDLRHALKAIGTRKQLRVSSQPPAITADAAAANKKPMPHTASKPAKETIPKSAPVAPASAPQLITGNADWPTWADGSDKRADESDDDYRLRKEIEGPPEARRKFIGEHDI